MDGGQDIQLSLNQVDAKLMAVEQDYERYKQMLEPYLGRTDLSDAEKEAVASIERAKAELAQKESALRKEKLALRKIELALMSQGRRSKNGWGSFLAKLLFATVVLSLNIWSAVVMGQKDEAFYPSQISTIIKDFGLLFAFDILIAAAGRIAEERRMNQQAY